MGRKSLFLLTFFVLLSSGTAQVRASELAWGLMSIDPFMENNCLDIPCLDRYRTTGAEISRYPAVHWGWVEPNPPAEGVHAYDWSFLDGLVWANQQRGYQLALTLHSTSSWASNPQQYALWSNPQSPQYYHAHPALRDEEAIYLSWRAFVQAFVERYDLDGVDDMPGLQAPIRFLSDGAEYLVSFYYQGTALDYLKEWRYFSEGVKVANPEGTVKILMNRIADLEWWDGCTTNYQWDATKAKAYWKAELGRSLKPKEQAFLNTEGTRWVSFINTLYQHPELFDLSDVGFYTFYQMEPNKVSRGIQIQKELMDHWGRYTKPIYATEGAGAFLSDLDANRKPIVTVNRHGYTGNEVSKILLGDRTHADYPALREWHDALQAKEITKVMVTFLADPGVGAFVLTWAHEYYRFPPALGDATAGLSVPDLNYPFPQMKVEYFKPAFWQYKNLTDHLKGFDPTQRENGSLGTLYQYKFSVDGNPVWVLWSEGGSQGVTLNAGSTQIAAAETIIAKGQESPTVTSYASQSGVYVLTVTNSPILVKNAGSPVTEAQLLDRKGTPEEKVPGSAGKPKTLSKSRATPLPEGK